MREISIGDAKYRLVAIQKDGGWTAHAERLADGKRFGSESTGVTEVEASERLTRWLEWQCDHSNALERLQEAERAYHRTIAGSAFVSLDEGPEALDIQKESLERVEAARTKLDEIRAARPE